MTVKLSYERIMLAVIAGLLLAIAVMQAVSVYQNSRIERAAWEAACGQHWNPCHVRAGLR